MPNTRTLVALGITLLTATVAQAAPIATIPVGPRPESITKAWHGKYYVSIQGPSGTLGVNDGEVRQVDLTTGVVTPFVTGLDNPRGLCFTGKYLIAADQVRLWKMDEAGNKTVLAEASAFPFPAVFFNDCAPEKGGKAIFVVEMGRRDIIRIGAPPGTNNVLIPVDSNAAYAVPATSRVYRVTMDGEITSMFEPSRKALVMNGVTTVKHGHKKGDLLVGDFFHGSIVQVSKKGKKNIIATAFRGMDGIEQHSDGRYFLSSFENGQLWKTDKNGENQVLMHSGMGFQSAADFYLDEENKLLYLPVTPMGAVLVFSTE